MGFGQDRSASRAHKVLSKQLTPVVPNYLRPIFELPLVIFVLPENGAIILASLPMHYLAKHVLLGCTETRPGPYLFKKAARRAHWDLNRTTQIQPRATCAFLDCTRRIEHIARDVEQDFMGRAGKPAAQGRVSVLNAPLDSLKMIKDRHRAYHAVRVNS